jgi:hypothetical protein
MSTNQTLYPTIISNPQRNANTSVQASTLMGGNLAQVFDIQALRTIKGRVVALGSGAAANSVVINEYDGSPVTLYPGDIVVSLSVSNGNATPDGSAIPYAPTQFTAGSITLAVNSTAPVFGTPTANEWNAPSGAGTSISAALVFGVINSGVAVALRGSALSTAVGANQWLVGRTTTNFTGGPNADGGGFVHVTLLVMNPILAQ